MIDSHCHLDHEPLFKDISNILKRSKDTGIKKLLTICTTLESFKNKDKYLKIAQWFLDPVSKKGPDYQKNKDRIIDKSDIILHLRPTSPNRSVTFIDDCLDNFTQKEILDGDEQWFCE